MVNMFKAGVQYNDFTGTVAADGSDELSFTDYLKKANLADDYERVVSFRVSFGGNHGSDMEKPGILAYLVKADTFVESPEKVRAVEVDMTMAQLFSFFKRFDLVMSNKAMQLSQTEVVGPDY